MTDLIDNTDPFDFGSLEDDISADGKFTPATKSVNEKFARKKYTCEACNGTGVWNGGRANRHGNSKCNTCHGTGQLVTSPDARRKARASAAKTAAKKVATVQEQNELAVGGRARVAQLSKASDWSEFAASLMDQHGRGKAWSDAQVGSIVRMLDKLDAKAAARKVERANAPTVDLTPIKDMFDAAVVNGYKAPKYRAEGIAISRAKDTSSNPGCLYVKSDADEYLGKVTPDLKFHGAYASRGKNIEAVLQMIATDPLEAALNYGRKTGRCACCGRELTAHASVDAGIGPICREKWGF